MYWIKAVLSLLSFSNSLIFIYWYSYVESAFLVFFVCFLRASCFPFASTWWQRLNIDKMCVSFDMDSGFPLQPWSWILNLWTLWVCRWMYFIKRTRVEASTGLCGSMRIFSSVPTPRTLCLPLMEPGEAATRCNTNIFTNNLRSIISLVIAR